MLLFVKISLMRYLLLLISFITTVASAQFNMNFYGQAGANYTSVRITRTTGIEKSNGGFGWEAGIGTEYNTTWKYFLYLGAGLRHQAYERDSTSAFFPDTVSQFKYRPLFLNFPFGIGYPFKLNKDINLKIYGGLNVQVGMGGRVKRHDLFYQQDSLGGQPKLIRSEVNEHDLHYGKASKKRYSYDLANSNWGVNIGTGVDIMQSFELNVFYHHGFTNFLPNRDAAAEVNKLDFVEINARFYLPNTYISGKKKRQKGY